MKFNDGYWLLRHGVSASYAKEAFAVETSDSTVSIAALTRPVEHRGSHLNTPTITVDLASPAPDVVSVRAYLIDWDDYGAFNDAYAAWFPERLPSRTCVGTTGLAVGALVEIDWVCWRENGWARVG